MGLLFGRVNVKVIYAPIRTGVRTPLLFWCRMRKSEKRALWPLDVPAEVWHLHVAPQHEGAGQVEAVLGIASYELVVFTEGITEHLVQSGGHRQRRDNVHSMTKTSQNRKKNISAATSLHISHLHHDTQLPVVCFFITCLALLDVVPEMAFQGLELDCSTGQWVKKKNFTFFYLSRHILLSGHGIFKQHPALHSYSHIFSPLGAAQYNHHTFWPMSTFSVAGLYGSHKATFMAAGFGEEVGAWNGAYPVTSLLPKLEAATLPCDKMKAAFVLPLVHNTRV